MLSRVDVRAEVVQRPATEMARVLSELDVVRQDDEERGEPDLQVCSVNAGWGGVSAQAVCSDYHHEQRSRDNPSFVVIGSAQVEPRDASSPASAKVA